MAWRAAACLLVTAAPAAPEAANFILEMTGMIAFVDRGATGIDVLLVNQNPGPLAMDHSVVHVPQLEIYCDHLESDTDGDTSRTDGDAKDCDYWPLSSDGERRIISLDRLEGFALQLDVGGCTQTGAVGRDAPRTFDRMVVSLAKLSGGDSTLATLRSGAQDDPEYVAVRLRLEGGVIEATGGRTGAWTFRPGFVYTMPAVADVVTWKIPYDPKLGVSVAFAERGSAGAPDRTLVFKTTGDVKMVLANEPDPFQFCAHAPGISTAPFEHFAGFYALTKYSEDIGDDVDALLRLPLPYAEQPEKQCTREAMLASMGVAGRRVNCMAVLFSD
jgi:hypothetical protein